MSIVMGVAPNSDPEMSNGEEFTWVGL